MEKSSSSMEAPEIEVPFHFLCPISLQLMQDPVTVSTGITYDRRSIVRWIAASKKPSADAAVCPVTKQPLSADDDLTPNHTLRRLIQSWCTLNAVDRIPTPKPSPVDRQSSGAIAFFVSRLLSPDRNDAVESLAVLAQTHVPENELRSLVGDQVLISVLTGILSGADTNSRSRSVKLLKSLYSVADPNKISMAKRELFRGIVELLRDPCTSCQTSKWALKLLLELSPWRRNRIKAAEAGAAEAMVEILLVRPEKRLCELAMATLERLCGCAEGRAGLLGHAAGLAVVSKKILRVSPAVSDRAVRILMLISKCSGSGGVVAEMLEVGVATKLCLLLQVDCKLKTKDRATEILRRHSRVWKISPCIPPNLLSSYP